MTRGRPHGPFEATRATAPFGRARASRPSPRRGFTVVEILVVLLVIGIVMGAVWTLFGHGVGTSRRVAGTLDAQKTLRAKFQAMVHELQGARKLFFPAPGGKSQEGVGFVDRSGKAVMFYTRMEGAERLLYRVDLNEKTKEVLARGVGEFRVTIPDHQLGEVARTVNLTFGMEVEGSEDEEGDKRELRMATSVTLRALEQQYPD